MDKAILSLDLGTTSNRAILFDRTGKILSMEQEEFPQYFPKPGWVEHDAEEIYKSALGVCQAALMKSGTKPTDIAAIGITNQRETTIVWDRKTGKPVYNAIVWQCRRTSAYCDELKEKGMTETFREKTGLVIDAYFSATKLKWILDNVDGVRERAKAGDLCFGTVETYMIWKLTGGKVHVTDYSNASRTMLFNIHTLQWDKEILKALDIPAVMLPGVAESSKVYGETLPELLGAAIPIAGAAGDQQAALFGQTCFHQGEVKNTYGTGCFLLMNTGIKPITSKNGLLTTIAWGVDGRVNYALEGSVFVAGAAVQWLRDELGLIKDAAESELLAIQVEDTNGCYFVPAFTGLGTPYWDQYARGAIVGLTRGCDRKHIARAALEAIAYQNADLLRAMASDSGIPVSTLQVDGGACANDFLMQFQADITNVPVERPVCIETTAMGAAFLAGLAVGYWKDLDEIKKIRAVDEVFRPKMSTKRRDALLAGWDKAIHSTLGWAKDAD